MKRSSRTASRRFGFAADSASPTSPSKPSFDHISHPGQGEPHNTQNSPLAASRDDADGETAKTPVVPWMRRVRRNSLAATPTYQGPSVKDEQHGDSPEKGGHSLRKRARVNYATEHIGEDLFAPSSTAPRSRKRTKPYGFEEAEDFSGPKAKRRNTSLSVDTPSTRRRNPARKPAEPKESKSFPTNTSFGNHFNDDNDIIRDTIEVGLSPSDMELVDSDELSSVGSSPSPKQEEDAESSRAQSIDFSKDVSREPTKEPETKYPTIKESGTKASHAKPAIKSTEGRPVLMATIKFNLAKEIERAALEIATSAATVVIPAAPKPTDVKEDRVEKTEAKIPESKSDSVATKAQRSSPIETEVKQSDVKEVSTDEPILKETEPKKVDSEVIVPEEATAGQAELKEAQPEPIQLEPVQPEPVQLDDTTRENAEPEKPAAQDTESKSPETKLPPEEPQEPKDNVKAAEESKVADLEMKDAEFDIVDKDSDAKNVKHNTLSTDAPEAVLKEAESVVNEPETKAKEPETDVKEAEPKVSNVQEVDIASTDDQGTKVQATESKSAEEQATEPKISEVQATGSKVAEVQGTEPESAEVQATEPKSVEAQGTEPESAKVQTTELKIAEVQATESKVAEVQTTVPESAKPQETESESTKPQETGPKSIETEEVEPKDIQATESNTNGVETEGSGSKDLSMKDAGVNDSTVKDAEVKDIEPNDPEAKDVEIKSLEVGDVEVKESEAKESEVEKPKVQDVETHEPNSKAATPEGTNIAEDFPLDTGKTEVSEIKSQDATLKTISTLEPNPIEAEIDQIQSPRAEIPNEETSAEMKQAESHLEQSEAIEDKVSGIKDVAQNPVEREDVEMNEAGSSQEHQLTQEKPNDMPNEENTPDNKEEASDQVQQTQSGSQVETTVSSASQEVHSPASISFDKTDTALTPQTPTKQGGLQSWSFSNNSENKEPKTPALFGSGQNIVQFPESPVDTTMISPPPINETPSHAVDDQDEPSLNQETVHGIMDDNSTATSIATPSEPNLPVDAIIAEPGEKEVDILQSQPVLEQPTQPTKSLESPSKKPMAAPVGRWSHLTPYVDGEFTSYPERRERSEDDDGSEDPSQETTKETNDPDVVADDNDDLPDVGASELPTGALNTPTRGSPVPESLNIETSNSPAPVNEDPEDAEITEPQEPLERALRFKYRKLRNADDFISVIDNYESMKTEDLYEMLQAINVSLVEWQDEWSQLGKVVDDFENASRRRIADSKYESRTRNLNQHGINFEEPDFAVKGYKAKEREIMSETRYLQQQDRTMAAAYGFEYDPHPSKIGRQNPETQQAGVTTRGRALRNQPRQTAKATEADGVTGKRQRKPVQLFDPATQDISRSSTPAPTRGKRRKLNENDDAQSMPTSSFNEDAISDVETTPNTRRRRGPRAKNAASKFDGPSSQGQDQREEPPKSTGRRARNKIFAPEDEMDKPRHYDEIDGQDESKPRRLLTLKIPKGTTISDTASTIEDNGDLRPSTASSDSTSHTVESSYSFRPKRQKRFRDEPDNGDESAQAPPKKRGRRNNVDNNRGDYAVGEGSSLPSESTANAGTSRKAPKIKVMRPTQESRNGTPTSQPTTEGGDDQPKDYRAMTKSEKMSASMKNRWANGNMAGAVEKRKATLAAKKAAQVAAEQKVGPIAPKQKSNKPSKKEPTLPAENPGFVHSPQFPQIPPAQQGAQHQHVPPHPQTHSHDLPPMGIPFPSSR
ncbi:unnamed protein product [Clonostachys byssicola]|uniref:Uncharacterized protein n=1 Tax=Clonostachys byssicola TaxID=160290 RepID=A0A9N9Y5F7_9HYPO|nr:unnamed protein product [Clonostachys byssicola]